MIRVRIELCPLGNEDPEAVTEIGRMYFANIGTKQQGKRGWYRAAVCRRGATDVPREIYGESFPMSAPLATRHGVVENYPRLAYNVWRLVLRGLRQCFPEEK